MIIRFTPEADAELAEARQWYAHQRENLDIEFMERIDDALSRIVSNPHSYPIVYERSDVRLSGAFRSPSFMKLLWRRFRSSPFSIRVEILTSGSHERDRAAIEFKAFSVQGGSDETISMAHSVSAGNYTSSLRTRSDPYRNFGACHDPNRVV
jgi:hypothetical protein